MKLPRTSIKNTIKSAKKRINAIKAEIRKVDAGIDQSDAKLRTIEAEIDQNVNSLELLHKIRDVKRLELLHKIRESLIELMDLDPAWGHELAGMLAAAGTIPPWRLLAAARTPYRRGSIVLDLPNT
jgi:hypothetical protein